MITTRNIDADQVQVTVQDSGTGLDPNTMGKIFEPFYTTKPGGMGMGLSISRSIVQNHGGRLWATANDGPGQPFTSPFRSTSRKDHMPESPECDAIVAVVDDDLSVNAPVCFMPPNSVQY